MNFEEMLESRNGTAMRKESMPLGLLYRKMNNKKYENVIDLRDDLLNSLTFCDALRRESQNSQESASNACQLKFRLLSDSSGIRSIALETGKNHTLQHLMEENPAVVATKSFVADTIKTLMKATEELHQKDIYHLCFAPSNILVDNNNTVSLLTHGSSYTSMHDYRLLYKDCEEYVAPEVLDGEPATPSSDVYSLGMLLKYLYQDAAMPIEVRCVINKATQASADKRYQSVADMRKALKGIKGIRVGLLSLLGVAAVVLLYISIFNNMTPQEENIEFVNPAPRQADPDDPLASSLSEDYELALMDYARDSLAKANADADADLAERELSDKEMTAKAEEIFRRQFTQEAERILSTVYTNERMSNSEEAYLAANHQAMRDLVKAQVQIAQRVGLNDTRAQLVAGEIIERISTKKMQQLNARKGGTDPVTGVNGITPSTNTTTPLTPNIGTTTTPSPSQRTMTTSPQDSRKERIQHERRREEIDRLMKENMKR